MVDLLGQYKEIEEEILTAIKGVIESSAFINGPDVQEFAKELAQQLECDHIIPCGNGTDALQIAFMGLGLQPGDEVIVPAFTYVASMEIIALLQLTPVFVDVDPKTFNIDPEKVVEAITPKTRAIIPVHLFGQCADMENIQKIAAEHNLYVVEDTAQAIGSAYTFADGTRKYAGTMGDIGTISFFPSKNLGAYGDGGAMACNNQELAVRLKMISTHGQSKKYYHEIIGVNSRLDTLQAALLRVKLKYLKDYEKRRQKAAEYYDQRLAAISGFEIPYRNPHSTHVFHQYTIQVKEGKRDKLKEFLMEKGIPSMIYYPLPAHQQEAYKHYCPQGNFPIAENLCQEVLSLPIHTQLTEEQQDYICTTIAEFYNES